MNSKTYADRGSRACDGYTAFSETTWSVKPITSMEAGDVLLPMREFPANNHCVRVRKDGEYEPCGVIEGDGAKALLESFGDPLPHLYVTEVSGLSKWAKAKLIPDYADGIGKCATCGFAPFKEVIWDSDDEPVNVLCLKCRHQFAV